jgi:hypothetical protein
MQHGIVARGFVGLVAFVVKAREDSIAAWSGRQNREPLIQVSARDQLAARSASTSADF